jgi:hypothetical protein
MISLRSVDLKSLELFNSSLYLLEFFAISL